MDPLVTFGLTVYRRPGYLLQSAGSIIAQTYKNWELLIGINPTDEEAPQLIATADLLCELDSRVSIVLCPGCNSGFAKTVKIVEAAQGEWMHGCDYDDILMPDCLEKQLPFIDRYDVISGQGIYFGKRDGEKIHVPSGVLRREHFRAGNPVVSPTSLLRRSDAKVLDWDYEFGPADYKMWVDLFNAGRRFYALPDVVALHRLADDSFYNARMDTDVVDAIMRMVK